MKLNNFMFKEEYAYTFKEVVEDFAYGELFTSDRICDMLEDLGLGQVVSGRLDFNYYALSFATTQVSTNVAINENAVNVLNKVYLRYKNHYAVVLDTDAPAKFGTASAEFMIKVFNVLDHTFDKYNTLLTIYAEQKSHLLDKLQRIRDEDKTNAVSGQHYNTRVLDEDKTNSKSDEHYNTKGTSISSSSSSGSQSASSDTPQTINATGDFDEINGYFNKFDKATDNASSSSSGTETDNGRTSGSGSENTDATETDNGSVSSSGTESLDATESFDPTTIMARIEEIQTHYENTMFKWVEEFDRLFIEEGNI